MTAVVAASDRLLETRPFGDAGPSPGSSRPIRRIGFAALFALGSVGCLDGLKSHVGTKAQRHKATKAQRHKEGRTLTRP